MALAACALACTDPPSQVIEAARYESDHFVVLDYSRLLPSVGDSFIRRLEADYEAVVDFLPRFTGPASIVANIVPGIGVPSVSLDPPIVITQWGGNLAFDYNVHLLIHAFTRYQQSQFLEEGLAVYGTELLAPDAPAVEPYRGQVPHAWVSLFAGAGTLIPFDTLYRAAGVSYEPAGSFVDASAWQFFIMAGSFTRWVFDTYGGDTFWRLFDGEDPNSLFGFSSGSAGILARWVEDAEALYPRPLTCREALLDVGVREEFWCALAEGTAR